MLAAVLQVAVVEVPFLQTAFGTASLDLAHWAVAIGMASLVLWTEELAKLAPLSVVPAWVHHSHHDETR